MKDHKKTASNGSVADSASYRADQKALIRKGKFRSALNMDITDVKDTFPGKYDVAIGEMLKSLDPWMAKDQT